MQMPRSKYATEKIHKLLPTLKPQIWWCSGWDSLCVPWFRKLCLKARGISLVNKRRLGFCGFPCNFDDETHWTDLNYPKRKNRDVILLMNLLRKWWNLDIYQISNNKRRFSLKTCFSYENMFLMAEFSKDCWIFLSP